ncbi:hypothetical protein F5146DRAFT_1147209 [Armillaria mellea]|nr:hypothetical protein F5146DRAFT_1147209 [Armillaria mellea]
MPPSSMMFRLILTQYTQCSDTSVLSNHLVLPQGNSVLLDQNNTANSKEADVLSTFHLLQKTLNHEAELNGNGTREEEQIVQDKSLGPNTHQDAETLGSPVPRIVNHTGVATDIRAQVTIQDINMEDPSTMANIFADKTHSNAPVNPNMPVSGQCLSATNLGLKQIQAMSGVAVNEQQRLMIHMPSIAQRLDISETEQGRGDMTGKRKVQEGRNLKASKRQK